MDINIGINGLILIVSTELNKLLADSVNCNLLSFLTIANNHGDLSMVSCLSGKPLSKCALEI